MGLEEEKEEEILFCHNNSKYNIDYTWVFSHPESHIGPTSRARHNQSYNPKRIMQRSYHAFAPDKAGICQRFAPVLCGCEG